MDESLARPAAAELQRAKEIADPANLALLDSVSGASGGSQFLPLTRSLKCGSSPGGAEFVFPAQALRIDKYGVSVPIATRYCPDIAGLCANGP